MHKPLVYVMMSVYNGEKFLREQIDSILAQESVRVRLFVRDDGSTDDTAEILRSYESTITTHYGTNLGAAHGFLEVARLTPSDADYYSFSDADDVWLPTKLSSAIKLIANEMQPAIVVTRLKIVDESLKPLGLSFQPSKFAFENALVQCVLSGAGSLFNRALFDIFRSRSPTILAMHDSWLYLIATSFGKIIYQNEPHILYRQHGSQLYGAGGFQESNLKWYRRLHSLTVKEDQMRRQAKEFVDIFGDILPPDQLAIAQRFAGHQDNIRQRMAFAASPKLAFNSRKSEALFRLRAFLGLT